MNEETQALMETPRCGCSDVQDPDTDDTRTKRYAIHRFGGWSKTDLTYKIINGSSTLLRSLSDDTLIRALAEWSNVTPLTFRQTSGPADLDIFFVSGDHEDGYAFDGPSGVLAHAFYPAYGGDAHFDADENWTLDANNVGIDLFLVGVHEFGHSLGLEHSNVREAIMYPFYTYQSPWSMSSDDIDGIQELYGSNESPTTPTPAPVPTEQAPTTPAPSSCVFNNIDAITSDKSGNIFIFHGSTYTLIDHKGIVAERTISVDFPEFGGKVDAAIYLPELVRDQCSTKKGVFRCYSIQKPEEIFVFSGTNYYRFKSGYLEKKKGKQESGAISSLFSGIPSGTSLDAAFTYDGTDIYLVSGDSVWKQERRKSQIENGYPKSLSQEFVTDLPADATVKDVLSLPTTATYHNYFFYASTYYRTTNGASTVDVEVTPYPRSIDTWWCDNNVENDLGYFKHHTIYISENYQRITIPQNIEL